MQNISGKTALITGGSRGIGKAIAIALAKEGVNVGITGRNEEALKKAASEIEAAGAKAFYAVAEVSDKSAITSAVNYLKSQLGKIDILINNAGVASFGSVLEMPVEKFEEIIAVNLLGVYYTTHAVLPGMVEQASGDIITISSTAGQRGAANTSAYSASKFGVLGFTESLMMEVRKHNIRVTAFLPSTVATDMAMKDLKITDGNGEKVLQPEDIAELIVMQLKLPQRAFVKMSSIWSTNP